MKQLLLILICISFSGCSLLQPRESGEEMTTEQQVEAITADAKSLAKSTCEAPEPVQTLLKEEVIQRAFYLVTEPHVLKLHCNCKDYRCLEVKNE